MKGFLLLGFGLMVMAGMVTAQSDGNPRIVLETTKGKIVIELEAEKAPGTVGNFLSYVDSGFYEGTIFHRVIDGFMVQGGGYTADMTLKPTSSTIQNEADNGLLNERGTVAMARRPDPHSASSQFFINTVDNDFLDFKSKTPQGWGYTVFGRVVSGMEVVDAIAKVETGRQGSMGDVPSTAVAIEKAYRESEATD